MTEQYRGHTVTDSAVQRGDVRTAYFEDPEPEEIAARMVRHLDGELAAGRVLVEMHIAPAADQ